MKRVGAAIALAALVALPAAAGPEEARPDGAAVVGTVAYRLGGHVLLAAGPRAALKPYQTLRVGRATRLIVVRRGDKLVRRWLDWRQVGTLVVRRELHGGIWAARVESETDGQAPGHKTAPGLRAGDIVYRLRDDTD